MIELIPTVEIRLRDCRFDWISPDKRDYWLALSGAASDEDVAKFIAELALFGSPAIGNCNFKSILDVIGQKKSLIMSGGLLFRAGNFEVYPSCCCGIESWRDWYRVKPGGVSPWMGHDPAPWIECLKDHAVVWADGGLGGGAMPPGFSKVSYEMLDGALQRAARDFREFLMRLDEWLSMKSPAHSALTGRIAAAFQIQ